MQTRRGLHLGLVASAAVLATAGTSLGAPTAEKSIDSTTGVSLNDYDGHPHRTAPKRVGEHINLWCRSTTNRRQVVDVRTFFEARQVAYRTIKCPRGDIPRRHQIYRPTRPGIYGMVLQGAGFNSFIVRTRVRPAAK